METMKTFTHLRPKLLAIAYRMLGSRADAEDIVQDAWLRWNAADTQSMNAPEGWLVAVTTRLAIDRLRIAQRERETYTGYWLPEPVVSVEEHSPEAAGLLAGEVSYALQWLLERLTPSERAAFLLRSVFDRDYDEIAAILQKTETACRQLVSRATQRLQDERVRFQPSPEAQKRLMERFVAAARSGELAALQALIDENAALVGDGGGKVPSFRHILRGRLRVAGLYFAMSRKYGTKVAYRLAWVNGAPGLLRYVNGVLESVQACSTDGERITELLVVRNPDKLAAVPDALREPPGF